MAWTLIALWLGSQPGFAEWVEGVFKSGNLWDWRLVLAGSVLTLTAISSNWREVERLDDREIFTFYNTQPASR